MMELNNISHKEIDRLDSQQLTRLLDKLLRLETDRSMIIGRRIWKID